VSFLETVERARILLERHRRVSLRALRRELAVGDDELEELVDVQRVARREGTVRVWNPLGTTTPATTLNRFTGTIGAAAADKAEARKVVTLVFADLIGSTALHERLDAESARRVMQRYYAVYVACPPRTQYVAPERSVGSGALTPGLRAEEARRRITAIR
jgi:class 3 adenylate cyclase